MKTLNRWIALSAIALASLANATAAAPAFDSKRAVELAATLIRLEFEKHPAAAIPGVDFDHPEVTAVRAGSGREFVFVSFHSTFANWGAYAIFELCGAPAHAVPNGYGKVIDIGDFRDAVAKIGPATKLALPKVCTAS
ncbi:MAG TPA: hypothetical protein VE046_01480 [Steroidobacteraceae bacterium]|nr:hypothetical protein [Steroidobacteraceae bacterium]